jgi:hypothetical protein
MAQPTMVEDPNPGDARKQKEDTPTLSASEMSSLSFHPFPKLPPELRLKIWKSACFPFTPSEHGLHYVDLVSLTDNELPEDERVYGTPMEVIALLPDLQTSPKPQEFVGRANRSAYMWDAGLWNACRESRGVIAAHFRLHISRRQKPSLPICLFLRNKEPAAPLMVMPTRDIFCIKNLGLPSLPSSLEAARLNLLGLFGQRTVIRHSFNLALEFDSSWNDEFPSDWYELKRENSPRGLFTVWLKSCREGRGDAPCIYLLNKAARRGPNWEVNGDTVFHDCDGAYVTVEDDYAGWHSAFPEETSATLRFLYCVWELWTAASCEDCTAEAICELCHNYPDFDLTKHVKVLIRHEQEAGEEEQEDESVDANDDNEDEVE